MTKDFDRNCEQNWKAAKAMLVLIPLLGFTYLITIAGPTDKESLAYYVFNHVRALLLSIQVSSLDMRWTCACLWTFSDKIQCNVFLLCIEGLDLVSIFSVPVRELIVVENSIHDSYQR